MNSMTVQELHQKLKSGENITVIDCRDQNEWDNGHIGVAKLIPLSTFDDGGTDILDNKSATIVVHCNMGGRSSRACQKLIDYGFESSYNLAGGIKAWKEAGYEIEYPE